jgi:propionate CoA-transferase
MRLAHEGVTVTEIAPGVDLARDVLAQSEFPLRVSRSLKTTPVALFRPALIGLALREGRS